METLIDAGRQPREDNGGNGKVHLVGRDYYYTAKRVKKSEKPNGMQGCSWHGADSVVAH
jgi:hypothetical protein